MAWRDEAAICLTLLGHEVITPMKRDYRFVTDMDPKDVVHPDLADILSCDGVLVEARLGASWGTAMEVAYAKNFRMPVVAIVNEGTMISYWLLYHVRGVAYTVKDAVNRLAQEMT